MMPPTVKGVVPTALAALKEATLRASDMQSEISDSGGAVLLLGDNRENRIFGDDQSDTILGKDGDDWVKGLLGDDWVYGGAGNDWISGGGGSDRLFGDTGNDTLLPGRGRDFVDGGAGRDTLSFFGEPWAVFVDLTANAYSRDGGWSGRVFNVENVVGSNGDDTIIGDDQDNTLDGAFGADDIFGGAGNDTIRGGLHDTGYSGNSVLAPGDQMWGGDGDNTFWFASHDHSISAIDQIMDFNSGGNDLILWDAVYESRTTWSAAFFEIEGVTGMLVTFAQKGSVVAEGSVLLVSNTAFRVEADDVLMI